jgi:formamidopyrimidine-DNA glycosylase
MPELPEVETVVRSLRPLLIGRRITGVELPQHGANGSARVRLRRLLATPAKEFSRTLCGARVTDVRRYGKNVVIELSPPQENGDARCLLVHLGMTGRLVWESTPETRSPHTHLVLALDAPAGWLHYTDIRRFGRLRVADLRAEELSKLGPDPLEIGWDAFYERLHSRRAMVKSLLLDQRFLRGIGNIYADESLFRSGIHPAAIAARLNRTRASRLYNGIRDTLAHAIERGGSSISDYVDAQGRAGWFQLEHQVYQRTGQACLRCGSLIRRMVIASRSTHFCPRCQRGPKRPSRAMSARKRKR